MTHPIKRVHAVENGSIVEMPEVQVSDRSVRRVVCAAVRSDSVLNKRRVQLDGRTMCKGVGEERLPDNVGAHGVELVDAGQGLLEAFDAVVQRQEARLGG